MSVRRIIWLVLGVLSMALGSVGLVLPILPTVPLYLAAAFCFTKSSKRLHDWFTQTAVYKKHIEKFAKEKSMTLRAKFTVTGSVTAVMALGFVLMNGVNIGRAIMVLVWFIHILYFFCVIRTEPKSEGDGSNA